MRGAPVLRLLALSRIATALRPIGRAGAPPRINRAAAPLRIDRAGSPPRVDRVGAPTRIDCAGARARAPIVDRRALFQRCGAAAAIFAAPRAHAAEPRQAVFAGGSAAFLQPWFDEIKYKGVKGVEVGRLEDAAETRALRVTYDPAKCSDAPRETRNASRRRGDDGCARGSRRHRGDESRARGDPTAGTGARGSLASTPWPRRGATGAGYKNLLGVYWRHVNPSAAAQFPADASETGPPFRTAIVVASDEERSQAAQSMRVMEKSGVYGTQPFLTEIVDAVPFRPVPEDGQDFYVTDPKAYEKTLKKTGRAAYFERSYKPITTTACESRTCGYVYFPCSEENGCVGVVSGNW